MQPSSHRRRRRREDSRLPRSPPRCPSLRVIIIVAAEGADAERNAQNCQEQENRERRDNAGDNRSPAESDPASVCQLRQPPLPALPSLLSPRSNGGNPVESILQRRMTPPLGSLEGRCSFIFLPRASSAGPGEPPNDSAGSGFIVRCLLPPSRVSSHGLHTRIPWCSSHRADWSQWMPNRSGASKGSISPLEQQSGSRRIRDANGVWRHRDYANAVPYDPRKMDCRFAGERIGASVLFGPETCAQLTRMADDRAVHCGSGRYASRGRAVMHDISH